MGTRREFLRNTTLAAGAAAAPVAASSKKIRVAVLGGGFGCSFQWHEHPNCEVVAVTDLYPSRRKALRDTYGCDSVYESFEDLLKKRAKDIDAVAVFS